MFLKIIGFLFVVGASTLICFKMAESLDGRLRDIRSLQLALKALEKEMTFLGNSLPRALYSAAKAGENINMIFKECAELLQSRRGYCVSDAWKMAVESHIKNTFLNSEDKNILCSIGLGLGQYDPESQSKNISLICSQLEMQEKKAEEHIVKSSKMYKNLGVLAGIAVGIMLL
jgi:stage III sporulation protein AB